MLDDIMIELAHFEVAYSAVKHPLRQIDITDQMLYDETFTKIRFMEKAMHVRAAYSVIEAIIRRAAKRVFAEQAEVDQSDHAKSDEEHEQSPEERPEK